MKFRRIVTVFLAILFSLFLPACTTDTPEETSPAETADTGILTNVFLGNPVSLPEDYAVTATTPYHDSDTGDVTVLCTRYINGIAEFHLVTIDPDGNLTNDRLLTFPEDITSVGQGVLLADSLIFARTVYDDLTGGRTVHLAIYSLADDTLTVSDDLTDQFPIPETDTRIRLERLAADGDGLIYITSDQNVVVFDQTFVKRLTYPMGTFINDLVTSPDGTVHIAAYSGGRYSLLPIDRETKTMLSALPIPDNASGADFFFGEGHDLFYATDMGLYGYDFAEQGQPKNEPVLLVDYASSSLIRNSIDILCIYSPDRMLMAEIDQTTYDRYPTLYSRSGDIDLSEVLTLEIAFTEAADDIDARIVEFNKDHRDVRIVPKDYSIYDTRENKNGGETKLINDILMGLYTPDIVTGSNTSDLLKQMYKNDLYLDLYPIIEQYGTITRDDIFGCVLRTGETPDGNLWTLGNGFHVDSLIGPNDLLNGRTGWTLEELLDFEASLPEGTELFTYLSQENVNNYLFGESGDGFNAFIDDETNTCNFETEGFLRYLEYLKSLPETYEEVKATYDPLYQENHFLLFHDRKAALRQAYVHHTGSWLELEADFNTTEYTLIGYPTADGKTSGSLVVMDAYTILPTCKSPEKAWAFLESVLFHDTGSPFPLRAWKQVFRNTVERDSKTLYEISFGGGISGHAPYTQEELETPPDDPGIKRVLTDEAVSAMLDWLDNHAGAPTVRSIDPEITQIIKEETGAYLGGRRTAEECANVIQSRVSIWLSEHE